MIKTDRARQALGVSQPRVAALVKEGCPLNSLRAADLWRENRGEKRARTDKDGLSKFADEPKGKGRPRKKKEPARIGNSLLDALNNAIAVADGAFEDYEEARINKWATRSIRLSEHNKALEARLKAEKAYREELERRKILVPIQEAVDMCRRTMDPVLRRLKKLPQESGPQCNPHNPLVATKILEAEINAMITVGRKALDAQKLLTSRRRRDRTGLRHLFVPIRKCRHQIVSE